MAKVIPLICDPSNLILKVRLYPMKLWKHQFIRNQHSLKHDGKEKLQKLQKRKQIKITFVRLRGSLFKNKEEKLQIFKSSVIQSKEKVV